MRPSVAGTTPSELFQHTLLWRDTFSALEICTRLIRTAGGLGLNTRFLGCGRLEAIFLKVMDMAYGHKGSDSQMIINMVYRVRPEPPPEVSADLLCFYR